VLRDTETTDWDLVVLVVTAFQPTDVAVHDAVQFDDPPLCFDLAQHAGQIVASGVLGDTTTIGCRSP
jgi:hypothetical protein